MVWCISSLIFTASLVITSTRQRQRARCHAKSLRALSATNDDANVPNPTAYIDGYIPEEDKAMLVDALQAAGFTAVQTTSKDPSSSHRYTFSKATGMLRLLEEPRDSQYRIESPPKWVPLVRGEENVLVANGWSFLDPDENEPLSAFDVDAANLEGQYRPKWGNTSEEIHHGSLYETLGPLSSLGFSLRHLSASQIEKVASVQSELTRSVLLEGATDPPQRKITSNEHDFSGSASQSDIERGVFCCAIGGLPLFSSLDLSPATASSGWLSFSRPVSDDHIILVQPELNSLDQRVEVLCAKTRCHLGHYFGKGNGYCINASALNFVSSTERQSNDVDPQQSQVDMPLPVSWRALEAHANDSPPLQLLQDICVNTVSEIAETLVFGAGCFWHVEFAFRRLPGVVSTEAGYAGGTTTSPTYEDVCEMETEHAEVVRVTFDPSVLNPRMLVDCFLALHDPTKVRAMGKHARGTGQYRSCIFVTNAELEHVAREALDECQRQLDKDLSTEIRTMSDDLYSWFWAAEGRHQRHDEKRLGKDTGDLGTLAMNDWLRLYGKRKPSVWGSSETISTLTSG